jgi:glycosyltransferase involved in cell wall biosynthesis
MSISSFQIIGSKQSGGAERFYVRLTEALHEAGHAVTAITPPGSSIAATLNPSVPQHPIRMRSVWDPLARWQISRSIRSQSPQIVQTWMGRATRLVSLPNGRPPIHIARLGGYYDLKGYRHAHAWIGNTQGICDYLIREGLPANRVFHVGNFIEPAPHIAEHTLVTLRAQWHIPQDAYVLLAAGRLHPNKGFSGLLEAFARLPTHIHDRPLTLVIAGDGPLSAELHAQACQLKLQHRVIWAGWQQDLSPFFCMADVFVCPSVHEPLGNVLLEAWANGVPLLSTATDGARELMTHEVDGLIVPCNDAEQLAAGIRNMLVMDDRARTAMIAAGRQSLLASHGKAAIVAAYTDLYQRLIDTCAA